MIRHQHLQSRGRKRDRREMLAPLTVRDKLPSASRRRHPALPCPPGAVPGGQCPSPAHAGSRSLLLSHWQRFPWFPVATNCQDSYRNPQACWLAGGVSQQGSVPSISPSLSLAVGYHCTWMEELYRQAKTQGWFGVLLTARQTPLRLRRGLDRFSSGVCGNRLWSSGGCRRERARERE